MAPAPALPRATAALSADAIVLPARPFNDGVLVMLLLSSCCAPEVKGSPHDLYKTAVLYKSCGDPVNASRTITARRSTTGMTAVSTHQKSVSDMTLPSWLQSLIAAFKVYFLPLRPAQQEEGEIKQENPGLRANFAAQRIYRAQVSAATTDASGRRRTRKDPCE